MASAMEIISWQAKGWTPDAIDSVVCKYGAARTWARPRLLRAFDGGDVHHDGT